ncbi:MAG TPA: GxxExxY protein [Candidatus Hydrogenedentes bacterium]|nr:GxxExxY protein [Candidatus Hydrogenedentota bacterium]HQM50888.1 GxxExxY protein [Candidatus Hydrogenedentota bacterium]
MSTETMDIDELTYQIIACAYRVHCALGPGFLEKVYENALRIELEEATLQVAQQVPIPVSYHGRVVGDFYVDLWIEDRVLVELKAVHQVAKEHEAQLVNYLQATGVENGLLINFGPSVEVKRKFKTWKPVTKRPEPPNR